MRVVAVIPARGGSKGVPLKNLADVGGVPLVARAVQACRTASRIDQVVVSTDHDGIAEVATAAGARVVRRPDRLAGDTASSESAVLHVLDVLEHEGSRPEVTVLVQCTSPFIEPADLDGAVEQVLGRRSDVVLSAVETYEFLWRVDVAGLEGVNHDPAHRPRRQDREPHYRETGAFYAMRTAGLRERSHRFFGRVGVWPVHPRQSMEVDAVEDLDLARQLASVMSARRGVPAPRTPAGRMGAPTPIDVDAVVTDFDGVHTDDLVHVDSGGTESVVVSRSDGMGVARLREARVPFLILSSEKNPVVAARAGKLGVDCRHGVRDKLTALEKWLADQGIPLDRVAYLGNDVNDLVCMRAVGWPVAVPDAHPAVLAAARTVLDRPGGAGAVRELCERVLVTKIQETRGGPGSDGDC